MKKSAWVRIVYLLSILFVLVFLMPMKASAVSHAEIRAKIIALLYGGDAGHLACDFDGYTTISGRHEGIDFAIKEGHNVYAIADGEVTAVRGGSGSLSTIAIYNSQHKVTIVYLHTKNFSVAQGDTVKRGDKIAQEGKNGTTSAHTHVELRTGKQKYAAVSINDSTLDNPNPYPYYEKILFKVAPTKPTIKSVTGKSTSEIEIKWDKADGADTYDLYWRQAGSGEDKNEYEKNNKKGLTVTSYTLSGLEAGKRYYAYVIAKNSNGTNQSPTVACYTKLASPTVTRENDTSSLTLSWKKPQNVVSYAVLRRRYDETDYKTIKTGITSTSYKDTALASGTKYWYRIKATCKLDDKSWDVTSETGGNFTTMAAPSVRASGRNGANISWETNHGNNSYKFVVQKKLSTETGYSDIATVTATSFSDEGLEAGRTYNYRIKAITATGSLCTYSLVSSITTESLPIPETRNLDVNCVVDGEWKGDTDGIATFDVWVDGGLLVDDGRDFWRDLNVGSAYHVTDIRPNPEYVYLGCYGGTAYGSIGGSDISIMLCFATVRKLDVNCIVDGTWRSDLNGIATCDVAIDIDSPEDDIRMDDEYLTAQSDYYKALPTGARYRILNITPALGYEYVGVEGGPLEGTIDARSEKSDISLMLCFKTGYATPKLTGATASASGITVNWDAVSGVGKYRVLRKAESDTKWTKSFLVTTNSYVDKTAVKGVTYTYTVRCMSGSSYVSDYDRKGVSAKSVMEWYATPTLTGATASSTGITVKWGAVSGVGTYRVFRKAAGETKWTKLSVTTDTSYTDKTAVKGVTYTYTVRCMSGSSYVSDYDHTGVSVKSVMEWYPTPKITSVKASASGIAVKWGAVSGVGTYRVFRKAAGETKWTKLSVTTETSYTDKTAVKGVTYTYTVRCMSGSSYVSDYDRTGVSAKSVMEWYPTPKITSVKASASGIAVKWGAVSGVGTYRVFRKAAGETKWTKLSVTTETSYTDKTAVKGVTYTYTVRCMSGSSYVSDYDRTGVSAAR